MCFFQFEIIINVFFSYLRFIWIPMLRVMPIINILFLPVRRPSLDV